MNLRLAKTSNTTRCGMLGIWRTDLNSVTIPCLIIAGVNAYNLWNEHWAHWDHLPPLDERPEYPYQNLRTKNFFWGNGDKVGFQNLMSV